MSVRFDYGQISRVQRTPQGGIRVDAFLTRTGVLKYRNPDGSERRELRRPEDVFRADSLAGLADAPVTDEHHGLVDSRNYQSLAKGHVSGPPRREGDRVAATLVIQDAGLVAKIEGGVHEVSCGYECDFDPTPGEHEGQRYDGVQRRIRYNHVAIVPKGRAGAECALRLDGEISDSDALEEYAPAAQPARWTQPLRMSNERPRSAPRISLDIEREAVGFDEAVGRRGSVETARRSDGDELWARPLSCTKDRISASGGGQGIIVATPDVPWLPPPTGTLPTATPGAQPGDMSATLSDFSDWAQAESQARTAHPVVGAAPMKPWTPKPLAFSKAK